MTLHILIHIFIFLILSASSADAQSMAMPNCSSMCGDVTIPYPFGIEKGCYHDEWFAITCNNVTNKPFLSKFNMEVLEVSSYENKITVMNPVASNCGRQRKGKINWLSTDFTGRPYNFFSHDNEFVVVGCDPAELYDYDENKRIVCFSSCEQNVTICKRRLMEYLTNLDYPYLYVYNISIKVSTTIGCTYAFVGKTDMNESYYSSLSSINSTKQVPVVLTWELENLDTNKYCRYSYGSGYYLCECPSTYTGNPYLPNGCKLAEACANCETDCQRIQIRGAYDQYHCGNKREIILGSSLSAGLLFLLLCVICVGLYKLNQKKRVTNLKKKFFKRNGGLLLEQHISSHQGTVTKTILFSSDELLKATDNYNENRILGRGGQGTVYKGMLTDGRIAAVKKSKLIDESQVEQFINEVAILSQINHRNIVKLLGCCLETEVPLLVYEFVVNGNLFDQLIHNENVDFPLSWKMRLQIATDVAGGLAYLHSASSIPIYHRDIKSTNIILDEKFRAKIADFGTSRLIGIEQTHLTTLVYGTFGYIDPEYFRSSQFTDKSDVYSFGVVLAELLTGQKPISLLNELEEPRGLAGRFTLCAEQMRVSDIMDARIIEEATKEEILAVSDVARRCLNLNGRNRPTMKEVLTELEVVSGAPSTLVPISFEQDTFNIESNKNRLDHDDYYLTPTMIKSDYRSSSSADVDPLVFYTL